VFATQAFASDRDPKASCEFKSPLLPARPGASSRSRLERVHRESLPAALLTRGTGAVADPVAF
jgi:hypothetical protein